jgi:predicted membrane protein (TIGR00267 family)
LQGTFFLNLFREFRFLLYISRSHTIARRYFVTNGFDGALAMLGLMMGFYITDKVVISTVLNACMGTAIALMMSGLSSAYVSEAAERQKELHELEKAMITNLDHSAHGKAARLIPLFIALVNGFSPFLIAMLIISPLWLSQYGVVLFLDSLEASIVVALGVTFLLGIFLGKINGIFWLWMGLRTLVIAVITGSLILLLQHWMK